LPALSAAWGETEVSGQTPNLRLPGRNMAANQVSYSFESSLESVNRAEAAAQQLAAAAGFRDDQVQEIAMAVREAVVNAVLHGNGQDPRKRIQLTFTRCPENFSVVVRDEGSGFNGAGLPDPLAPENLLKESGRGIFLIRSFMDEVRFRNLQPGTEITLIKHVRGAAADAKEKAIP
jgi:serine/threonine-protein kinase RsbW